MKPLFQSKRENLIDKIRNVQASITILFEKNDFERLEEKLKQIKKYNGESFFNFFKDSLN